jgi:hypothetical protein
MSSQLLFIFKNKYHQSDDLISMESTSSNIKLKCTCQHKPCYHITYLIQKLRNDFYSHLDKKSQQEEEASIHLFPIDNSNILFLDFVDQHRNKLCKIYIRLQYNSFYFGCNCTPNECENFTHHCDHLKSLINYVYQFYDPIHNTLKVDSGKSFHSSEEKDSDLNELLFSMEELSI